MTGLGEVREEALACTFCAYCRRSCPVYRASLWEGESPRGRVAQAHGLILGELEPSDEFYESVLNCSLCGLCEEACPSSVRVRDIVLAMRAELLSSGASLPERVRGLVEEAEKRPVPLAEGVVVVPGIHGRVEETVEFLSELGVEAEAVEAPPLSALGIAGSPRLREKVGEYRERMGRARVVCEDPAEVAWLRKAGLDARHPAELVRVPGAEAYLPSAWLPLEVEAELTLEPAGSEVPWLRREFAEAIAEERASRAGGREVACLSPEHVAPLRRAGADAVPLLDLIRSRASL
ncbi:MAG: hypothetical protein DRO06_02485 [Thermoproteota archaeon]|nr:MAG: hypothetical protein DRO06_02485 [Candidatus Korarchaeota archaeon]